MTTMMICATATTNEGRPLTAADDSFNTPATVLDRVRAVAAIGLDPCSNQSSIVDAKTEWLLENGDDGLTTSWRDHGLTFFNPGYSNGTQGKWTLKAAHESRMSDPALEIIGLLQARTDTGYMKKIWDTAQAVCFWNGRITFRGQTGPGRFASMVPYWGVNKYRFADAFQSAGKIVLL